MGEFKERELKKFNEMSEKERMLNIKPLIAYENMTNDANVKLPGFLKPEERENFRRYAR